MSTRKKVTLTISPDVDQFRAEISLAKFNEDGLEILFSDKTESDDSIEICVKKIISIPKEDMKEFCYEIVDNVIDYEKQYCDGFGINMDDSKEDRDER